MHRRGSGGRDPFSDFNPFAGFGGFGGFTDQRSLMSNFFGGRDPFDDPFFTQPFGGMFQSSIFGSFGSPFVQPFGQTSGFLEQQAPIDQRSTGPIIEELNSDEEKEDPGKEKSENPRKLVRSSDKPLVEDPEEDVQEKKHKYLRYGNDYSNWDAMQSQTKTQTQASSFTFQSSSVTYGGPNGAYYTSSTTKSRGSDGMTFEESKEADSSTRKATHQISRGLHNKGHSVTRMLHTDGKVDSMQTLHNLNEDELAGFEDAWKVNARKHLPGWRGNASGRTLNGQIGQGGLALPAPQQSESTERLSMDNIDRQQGSSSSRKRRGRN